MISFSLGKDHQKQLRQGIKEGGTGPECHQGIHIGSAVKHGRKAGCKELPVDDHYDCSQQQLKEPQKYGIIKNRRRRPPPHAMAHGEIHEDQKNRHGKQKPFLQFGRFVILQSLRVRPGRRIAGGGCLRRSFQGSSVSGGFHSADDVGRGSCSLHAHGVRQQAYRARRHARYA